MECMSQPDCRELQFQLQVDSSAPEVIFWENNLNANYPYGDKPMNEQDGMNIRGIEHLTPDERHRLNRANQICQQVSQEVGFDLEGIEQVAVCVEFMSGHIDEPELWERARAEMEYRMSHWK